VCNDGWGGVNCASAITQSAWEQWYQYWVAIIVSGCIAILLFLLWQVWFDCFMQVMSSEYEE
jgi:hypothetical protein